MPLYRLAGQEIYFTCPLPEVEMYRVPVGEGRSFSFPPGSPRASSHRVEGFVGGRTRGVETWPVPTGTMLRVEGGREVFIASDGCAILFENEEEDVTALDREVLLGPALVLALASRRTFCLHASAAQFRGRTFIFLGESGQGKSTLAAYLSGEGRRGWLRVADDILAVTTSSRVEAWPHFPQLKLPVASQPGTDLPERVPLEGFFLLQDKGRALPGLKVLPHRQALQSLLGHTAGARLFDPRLLADHLVFCGEASGNVRVYALTYPHRRETLAEVRDLLEDC